MRSDTLGATSLVETLILLAMIAFVVILGVEKFGGSVLSVFGQEEDHVASFAPGSDFSFAGSGGGAPGSATGGLGTSSGALGTSSGALGTSSGALGTSSGALATPGGGLGTPGGGFGGSGGGLGVPSGVSGTASATISAGSSSPGTVAPTDSSTPIGSASSALGGAGAPESGGIGALLATAFEAVLDFLIPPAHGSERHGPWVNGGIHDVTEGQWTDITHHHALPGADKKLPEIAIKSGIAELWDEAAVDVSVAGIQVWDKPPLAVDHDFWVEQQVFQPRPKPVETLNDYQDQGGTGGLRDFVDRRNALRRDEIVLELDGAADFIVGHSTGEDDDIVWQRGKRHVLPRTPDLNVVVVPTDVDRCKAPVAQPNGPACESSFRVRWHLENKGVEVPAPGS